MFPALKIPHPEGTLYVSLKNHAQQCDALHPRRSLSRREEDVQSQNCLPACFLFPVLVLFPVHSRTPAQRRISRAMPSLPTVRTLGPAIVSPTPDALERKNTVPFLVSSTFSES
ncbi:unnamed protein product [Euphydryas editha]|uniref:Uncharacterized protein n=1 Tax=Euphydryas editha TaxID=104508 RepID=A0AAU9UM00_EUPED|nr:unnamed protein product [Euphydryas editha]